MRMQNFGEISVSHKFDWPHENQKMGIAIAMITGQSGKVAAVVSQKLHSVVDYIVYFSNTRIISIPFIHLSGFVSVLMQYTG